MSLTSYVLLWSFTSWKLLFRQPCVQFSLQATRPLKDYPRNSSLDELFCKAFTRWSDDHLFFGTVDELCDDDTVENFVMGDSINEDQS